jgi:putative aminopeptidase FrvX
MICSFSIDKARKLGCKENTHINICKELMEMYSDDRVFVAFLQNRLEVLKLLSFIEQLKKGLDFRINCLKSTELKILSDLPSYVQKKFYPFYLKL